MTRPGLTGVQSGDVARIWPFVEEMISDALMDMQSSWALEDIAEGLGCGEMQLWLATSPIRQIEAVAITRLTEKGCSVCAVTGEDPDRWTHLLSDIEGWARSLGQPKIYFEGRRGWERKLPDYRVVSVIMEKELLNG